MTHYPPIASTFTYHSLDDFPQQPVEPEFNKRYYTVSETSAMCFTTDENIRYWAGKFGFKSVSKTRTIKYDADTVKVLYNIRMMSRQGVKLWKIKELLKK